MSKLSKIEKTKLDMDKIEVNEDISQESRKIMKGYQTIAMFGLDNRSNGNLSQGRSDVIMLANINNDTKRGKIGFCLPRHLFGYRRWNFPEMQCRLR